ncbi:hypothetical protein MTR67_033704 [Solanum verrucosum]|uniref:NAD-dependent epimerase/dehydratase domain-containing protein n=1 Tax=Solanum verrucosum TaxID=315347 RepID=A0AAF0U718_SOLVR|nr:hypothetical protein MTR67_033704 [Solanum verrucosum]
MSCLGDKCPKTIDYLEWSVASSRNVRFLSTESNKTDEPFKVEEAETVNMPPPPTEKLLVLGGNGFVGSHICKEALDRGLTVASLSRTGRSSIQDSWANSVIWHQGNLFSTDSWKDALKGVTSVISCVGGFGSNSHMYKINGTANINAIRAASEEDLFGTCCWWEVGGGRRPMELVKWRKGWTLLRSRFLWQGNAENNGYNLVVMENSHPEQKGGRNGYQKPQFQNKNKNGYQKPEVDELTGKMGIREEKSLSREVINIKYGSLSQWSTNTVNTPYVVRKSIRFLCDVFERNIELSPGNGRKIAFWNNKCNGQEPLRDSFPGIHRLARNTDATISEVLTKNFNLRRGLNDWEMEGLYTVLQLSEGIRALNEDVLKRGVKRFVYISAADFGIANYVLQGYYEGKRAAETELLTRYPYGGIILRPGFIYGTRRVGSMKLPLGVIGSPLEMILQRAKPLSQIPLVGPLFTPPVNVTAVAKVAVRAATDPVFPPGVIDVHGILRYSQQRSV